MCRQRRGRALFNYTVKINDPTSSLSFIQSALVAADLRGALDIYSRHVSGQGSLDVIFNIDPQYARGSGASAVSVFTGTSGGKTIVDEGAVSELKTGVDPNGAQPDVLINLSPAGLASMWLDPDPTTRAIPVAAGKVDLVSFFLHELGHALGFNGFGDGATGVASGAFMSRYDTFVTTLNGGPVFLGGQAVAAYGGAVPLSDGAVNSYQHYGRVSADGLDLHLMEGSASAPPGGRWHLDGLDLAFLRDFGLSTVAAPIADTGGSRFESFAPGDTLTGGVGADTLIGGGGSDSLFGAAGDDVLSDSTGSNYLRGEDGSDRITGGVDFDDINGNAGSDTASGGGGGDWVVGGKDRDLLHGDEGDDLVYGNLGDDTCDGGAGADVVRGGQGSDSVAGGAGDDWLSGDRDSDTLSGGAGADTFHTFADAGLDRVIDFSRAEGDRVLVDPGTVYAVAQLGGDVVIAMGASQMVLAGVQMSSLTGDWIVGA